MTDEEFDEILAWQMTGWLKRQAPQRKHRLVDNCRSCGMEWHGLPKGGCEGSFEMPDTPKPRRNSAAI